MCVQRKIEKFLSKSAMPPATFGRRAAGDPRLVSDLRNGREPRPPMVARIEAFLAAQGAGR